LEEDLIFVRRGGASWRGGKRRGGPRGWRRELQCPACTSSLLQSFWWRSRDGGGEEAMAGREGKGAERRCFSPACTTRILSVAAWLVGGEWGVRCWWMESGELRGFQL